MREFVVFSQHLNMTRASQELLMTQSNLSKHIKQLETELGFLLVYKNGNRTHLTRQGECFLNFCNSTMGNYERTVEKCKRMQTSRRVGIVAQEPSYSDQTAEAYYGVIEDLCADLDDVAVRYVRPYRKNLLDELEAGRMDIAISYRRNTGASEEGLAELESRGFAIRPLIDDCLSVWCEASHPLASKANITLEDLANYSIIQPNDTYTPIRRILMECERERNLHFTFNMVESDRSATFLSMRYSECVYVLPSTIQNDLRVRVRKDRVFVPLENNRLIFTSYAIMHKGRFEAFPEFAAAFEVDRS